MPAPKGQSVKANAARKVIHDLLPSNAWRDGTDEQKRDNFRFTPRVQRADGVKHDPDEHYYNLDILYARMEELGYVWYSEFQMWEESELKGIRMRDGMTPVEFALHKRQQARLQLEIQREQLLPSVSLELRMGGYLDE